LVALEKVVVREVPAVPVKVMKWSKSYNKAEGLLE